VVGTAALTAPPQTCPKLLSWLGTKFGRKPGGQPNAHARYRSDTMFYEVLVLSDGGERFTIERDAPLAAGDSFPNESEFYRVVAIEPGHGPFAAVIQAERLSTSGSGEVAPA
jgi:hypothetical protein